MSHNSGRDPRAQSTLLIRIGDSRMDIHEIDLDELILDPNLNLRDRLDEFTVERYADVWDRMPPITVFEVDGQLLVADGFHRHAAAVHLKLKRITVEVRHGTFQDALDFVASANLSHGLPLTRSERRRAVEVKLRIHYDWSDRRMSEELGVSRELVAKIRRVLIESHQIPSDTGRVGSDGKTYPAAPPREHIERPAKGRDVEEPRGKQPPPWESPLSPMGEQGRGGQPVSTREPVDARTSPEGPIAPPSIDEMLAMMATRIQEVVNWTAVDGFTDAYRAASANARGLFQTACLKLAARADQLRKG